MQQCTERYITLSLPALFNCLHSLHTPVGSHFHSSFVPLRKLVWLVYDIVVPFIEFITWLPYWSESQSSIRLFYRSIRKIHICTSSYLTLTIHDQHSNRPNTTNTISQTNTMLLKNTLLASALALCAFSAPLPAADSDCEPTGLTAEELVGIAKETASCDGAPFPDECADATRAVTAINKSFETYKITSVAEQAAAVAYMLFESGNFKYSKNHFPGRPGQGTRMMAMPPIVEQYATSVAGAAAVAQAQASGGDKGLSNTLALVNSDDEKSFGAAAWFLTTCSPEVRTGLDAGTVDGWHAFLTSCVQTTLDPLRDEPWIKAKQVMLG
jgi:hypothetical protein